MTDRHIAFLRGINVGRAKRIGMADLRSLFEELGCAGVQTLLASGNVVFSPPGGGGASRGARSEQELAVRLEQAILVRFGVTTAVTLVPGKELEEAVRHNPLAELATEPSRFLVMILRDAEAAARLKPLLKASWDPEAVALWKRFAYIWCPSGLAGSKLWTAADRAAGGGGTARNLATMEKLVAMAGA